MALDRIATLLGRCNGPERNFPPTDLYCEGWMLRLVLDWFSRNPGIDHDLAFAASDRWYSEALLPTAFIQRFRGDKLAESWTHADGVIGDFVIGADSEGDLSLAPGASRILVTEAKMFSKLSSGVTNAKYYNQAARNVACIAEAICRAEIPPSSFDKIGFFVIAPEEKISAGVFAEQMDPDGIRRIVTRRVSEYREPERDQWLADWFLPVLERIRIREISWEEIIGFINQADPASGAQMDGFYGKCIAFNQKVPGRFAS